MKTEKTLLDTGQEILVIVPEKKKKKKTVKSVKAKAAPNKAFNRTALIKAMIDTRFKNEQTIAQAAKIAKIPPTTFQQIEAIGNCKPDALAAICNWLGVKVQTFFE